jgi:hypothetical protein
MSISEVSHRDHANPMYTISDWRERNSLADTHQIHKDYFLLFYTTTEFLEKSFVRCILLFNKTWKEMRACEVDFQVVRFHCVA